MDAFLHKLLYFKEPEWFHDLTHEEIVQLNCVFEQYEPVLGSLIERKTANQYSILVIMHYVMALHMDVKDIQN